jgi:hypothetical protein
MIVCQAEQFAFSDNHQNHAKSTLPGWRAYRRPGRRSRPVWGKSGIKSAETLAETVCVFTLAVALAEDQKSIRIMLAKSNRTTLA